MIAKYSETDSLQSGETLLIDSEQARLQLGISARTLWSLTNEGEIPCVRIRRKVLYDPAELRDYIEKLKTRQRK